MPQNTIFRFLHFWAFSWPKNSQNWKKIKKIGKIQTIWWNFLKFGMYIDTSRQKKMFEKKLFFDFGIFWYFLKLFLAKKQQKKRLELTKNKVNRQIQFVYWFIVCNSILFWLKLRLWEMTKIYFKWLKVFYGNKLNIVLKSIWVQNLLVWHNCGPDSFCPY